MNDQQLTDEKVMLLIKAALDNNAAIIQQSSFLFGNTKYLKPHSLRRWEIQFRAQWRSYQKQVDEILGVTDDK